MVLLHEREVRHQSGASVTEYSFTGQFDYTGSFGLLFFNARFFDPSLSRFISADSIVPPGAQGLDRYAYVNNSPLNYVDPSGHDAWWCETASCSYKYYASNPLVNNYSEKGEAKYIKDKVQQDYGITISDDGSKSWTLQNLRLVDGSLAKIDSVLNGNLKDFSQGWTFRMQNQGGGGYYHGETATDGSMTIDFFTIGTDAIRQINVFHEVGHLLDNVTGMEDTFTNAVNSANDHSWMSGDTINPSALLIERIYDPNYGTAEAIQGILTVGASDQWADAFANYVGGNIRRGDNGPGDAMYTFVHDALTPYTGTP